MLNFRIPTEPFNTHNFVKNYSIFVGDGIFFMA